MSRLAAIFVRLCLILIGYAFAILVASLFLHLLAWPSLGFDGETPDFAAKTALAVSVLLAALFGSYYAFVPAAVFVGLAELQRYRSWLYFAFAGGLSAVAARLLYETTRAAYRDGGASTIAALGPQSLAYALAAGMVGGLAYWLIAGRGSGGWRRRVEPSAPEPSES
ncbi:MAG: hypothetical protein JJ913_12350 [Rhizobiaceae bacterium]|nr:hypothetical protein [Rhizobiaceae bacterium]